MFEVLIFLAFTIGIAQLMAILASSIFGRERKAGYGLEERIAELEARVGALEEEEETVILGEGKVEKWVGGCEVEDGEKMENSMMM